jgi:hypothetical protein
LTGVYMDFRKFGRISGKIPWISPGNFMGEIGPRSCREGLQDDARDH